MFSLEGQCVLVTGASGGLGSSIAKKCHDSGAHVILSGTKLEKLEALAEQVGSRTSLLPANLSLLKEATLLYDRAVEIAQKEGIEGVSVLVNNAGITKDALLMRMKDEDLLDVLQVNLISAFATMRGAIKHMMKKRYGRIINVTSVVGVTGNAGQANYAASKAGLIGFSKSLAKEVASRGITVNCVAPGFIESPMTQVLNPQQKEKILQGIPAGIMGTGEDIASGVLFLASKEASYVTGTTLHINGGMYMA